MAEEHRAQEGFVNFGSASHSQIEALRSERRDTARGGPSEAEDRFGKGAASQNSQNLTEPGEEKPWFSEGLRFKCTGCGKCCTGSPGYVFLSSLDFLRLADHLKLSSEEFAANYTYKVDDKISLIDSPGTSACVFLKENQCSVYEARPTQCRTFPWWIHLLHTRQDWEEAGKRCEGIEHPDAPLVSPLHIQEQCLTYLDNLLEQNFS